MDSGDLGEHDAMRAAKARLRARRVASRAAMTPETREQARAAVRDVVLERVRAAGWRCAAAYVPLSTEPGSTGLLVGLRAAGLRLLVPITLADRDLDWAEWSADGIGPALGKGAIGDAELVLVPAFAVGDDGMRLGRGGGSYDRALVRSAPSAETAAVLFDGEREPSVPAEPWDRPVDGVITPSGWSRRNTGARRSG
ncbi:5-formyltetrahydrofolate cyclo-ligase [uncultured Jatrophihabitans sp.]|uniref:5-formyltetrahydrofolate cyclo-ligase n=1 Tax=uncultured Jatrophihabitans sp. TaxID=1610747 RepID=UPI0035CBC5F0